MFTELVERFKQYETVKATVYQDGLMSSMEVIFSAGMNMEVLWAMRRPPHITLNSDGVYLDSSQQDQLSAEDALDYQVLRLMDPRVLVEGLVSGSERPDVGNLWNAEYDLDRLLISLSVDHLELASDPRLGLRRAFSFVNDKGLLSQMAQRDLDLGVNVTLRFEYSNVVSMVN